MIRCITLLLLTTYAQIGHATVSDEEFSDLKNKLMSLLNRVDALEAENRALKKPVVASAATAEKLAATRKSTGWTETVKLKGDFRYRYENIDAQRSDTRERNRIRARVAVTAKPSDNVEVGIGLASGTADAVSTNQTLGDGGTTKELNLDLAYFKWQAKPGLHVIGGKMKNVFYRPAGNGLLWDGDYRPEGLGFTFTRGNYFLNTVANFLESDANKDNKTLYGFQTGFTGSVGDRHLVAGVGYFEIDTKGREVFNGDADDFFGNTFSCINSDALLGCTYNNSFAELELFAQLSTTLGETPVSLFADLVQNQDASELDTAWATGLKVGKASTPNTWEFSYVYQDIEADAVLGLVTDSDFAGGGTDTKGHRIRGAWAINKKWKIGFTYFDNERNMDIGVAENYKRLMLDTAYKF
ncbi:MAG: putative porin [Candidatus Azotimanducaceae bacterium WSBS_2022_MAG_OTU7]